MTNITHEEAGSHETAATAAALEGLKFPADKTTIIAYVRGRVEEASKADVLTALDKLADTTYESPMQVMAELPE